MLSHTEENYLRAIYTIQEQKSGKVSTNSLSKIVCTAPPSVTDMLKRLAEKGLIEYEKYKGAQFSPEGKVLATMLVRKHRLWESFLVEKLDFSWEEVHVIADQLEHVNSKKLIDRLDKVLNYPKFDPHGEPIPSKNGKITLRHQIPLFDLNINERGVLLAVRSANDRFLNYLKEKNIPLGSTISVNAITDYDNSRDLLVNNEIKLNLNANICKMLMVKLKSQA